MKGEEVSMRESQQEMDGTLSWDFLKEIILMKILLTEVGGVDTYREVETPRD